MSTQAVQTVWSLTDAVRRFPEAGITKQQLRMACQLGQLPHLRGGDHRTAPFYVTDEAVRGWLKHHVTAPLV